MHKTRSFLYVTATIIAAAADVGHAATSPLTRGDASIRHDATAGTWTLSAGGAALTVAFDPSRDFEILSLVSPSGHESTAGATPGTSIIVNGSALTFGSRASGFRYEAAAASDDGHVLHLDATLVAPAAGLRVVKHFAIADGSPAFETWSTYEATGSPISASNLNGIQLLIAAGTVHWATGRHGDDSDATRDSAFMLKQQTLAAGPRLALGSDGRSSEQVVPWLAFDGSGDEFFAALMWSGAWSLDAQRGASGIALSWGLQPMTTAIAAPVDGPHVIFGAARGGLAEASAAMRSYVVNGVRAGRPFTPLVTYNTWFAYGTNVDERSMRSEMDRVAALGAELFVLDAGWYTGADTDDPGNFDVGLGSWDADPARFPNGLRALSDYAHGLGMKFGLWIEPERVNLSAVGDSGVDETWLATSGGDYDSDHSAQVCLAGAAGRQWVFDHLSRLIDEAQPDYLKWDNNLWVSCDRAGHGHGSTDGSFAHVTALYQILDALRQRYPNLLIENCSGGGNRIDFAMVRYTDVAWMDDDTAPSVHVRHNLEGLALIFPPAYLLSFVTNHDTEPLHDGPDLPLYVRSRMGGALGLCFRSDEFSDTDVFEIAREIAIYKTLRTTLAGAAAALLTSQAEVVNGPSWDILQASGADGTATVLYAYQNDDGEDRVNVKPADLSPDALYQVSSVDVGVIGIATGTEIMAGGVDILRSSNTAAHILVLVRTE